MYSDHNFYFKPYIASLALLPVTDRKSLEAPRFIKQKASIQHCLTHHNRLATPLTLLTTNAIAE